MSSECSSIPSPRTHNRSVSHDSYFNLLERSGSNTSPPSGPVKEERESDADLSPENSSKLFLDISELNLEFNTSEAEMKIFSEDDTLKSTSVEDTLSRSTVDIEENASISSDVTKSKESVSSREKKSLKDKLRKRFTSPSSQRKETTMSDSSEDSRSNSLKRASSVIKDKLVQALSPETSRRKAEASSVPPPQRTSSPIHASKPQVKSVLTNEKGKGLGESAEIQLTKKPELTVEVVEEIEPVVEVKEERTSIESALIDPELLDKITRMRVSPSVSASEVSSVSLAEATVSDNESFTLGSSSNTGSHEAEVSKGGVISDSGSTLPHSLRTTPCTPPVTIVADPHFQEEIFKREISSSSVREENEEEEQQKKRISKPPVVRDRPNSLLGIPPSTESCGLGSALTSPETPQGDSTFLEIQYHPLSDTTEPSTPSDSHFMGNLEGELAINNLPRLSDPSPRPSSPLSPDLSSSSADDPIENGPLYENIQVGALSSSKLSNLDVISTSELYDSSSKVSPEIDTPTAEESEMEYENIQYNALEASLYEDEDSKIGGSDSITPSYENLSKEFPSTESRGDTVSSEEAVLTTYENVVTPTIQIQTESLSDYTGESEYEEYSFKGEPSYENVEFVSHGQTLENPKSEAEIDDEVVYQQVKYLKKSIQEVNEMLNEKSYKPQPLLQSFNLTLCQSDHEGKREDVDAVQDTHVSEGSECLDSPVTPSSSSLVTEVLVLPSFSSPTESMTEDAISPDASESQSSPKQQPSAYSISPCAESLPTNSSSPNSVASFIPTLSPPSPDLTGVVPLVATLTCTKNSTTLTPSPWPRTGPKLGQVWPPVPKPRHLPSLSAGTSPSNKNSSSLPDSPPTCTNPRDDLTSEEVRSDFVSTASQPRNVVHIVQVPPTSSPPPEASLENKNVDSTKDSNNRGEKIGENSSQSNKVGPSERSSPSSASDKGKTEEESPHPLSRAPVFEDEAQKRERIEKYKKERRSFLREKYKSESFKGEKDDMLLRLKQKATSPSRQDEENGLEFSSATEQTIPLSPSANMPDISGSVAAEISCVPSLTTLTRFQSSSGHSSTKTIPDSKIDKCVSGSEILLNRSMSEDHTFSSSSNKDVYTTMSSTNSAGVRSSTRTLSESCATSRGEFRDDDINVKERVAIWNRHEGTPTSSTSSTPSQKRDCVNTTLPSHRITPPKLRKAQSSSNSADSSGQSKPSKVTSPTKNGSTISPPPFSHGESTKSASGSTSIRVGRSQPYPSSRMGKVNGSKGGELPLPPQHQGHKEEKNRDDSTKKEPSTVSFKVVKGGTQTPAKRPVLVTQKSESDLREPVMLKARSYSIGSGLGTPGSCTRSVTTSAHHQKSIKDMKALFERGQTPPNQDINRSVVIKPSSKDELGK